MSDISFEKARDKAFRYLGYKARTYKETYEKLKEYEAPEDIICQVMELLLHYGYVDDGQYARDYICERSKKYGFYRIKHELRQKGIPEDIIKEAAGESDLDELDAAIAQLRKKTDRTGKSSGGEAGFAEGKTSDRLEDEDIGYKEKRQYYDYLARRGFSHDTIKEAFRKLSL